MAQRRRRHKVAELVDERRHPVRCENFEGSGFGWRREGVGVSTDEYRPRNALRRSILDDRLGDRGDVSFGEGRVEGRTAVPARAEDHALFWHRHIRHSLEVGRQQFVDVDEIRIESGQAGASCHGHSLALP